MFECEMKLPLTKREQDALLELADDPDETIQTNYYYDTEMLDMQRKGITCRIREHKGSFVATKKTHLANGVSNEETSEATGPFDISQFGKNVKLYGEMITHRTVLLNINSVVAALDKNTYLGTTDYELEIEYEPEQREEAERWLRYYADNVDSTLAGEDAVEFIFRLSKFKAKSARFFDYYSIISANIEEVLLDEVVLLNDCQ